MAVSQLHILSTGHAASVQAAFEACLAGCRIHWDVVLHSSLSRAQARQVIADGGWDALFLDGQFGDLTRSAVKVQAASMQVAGGADLVFARKETTVAVNLFGAACASYVQHLGYSLHDSTAVVCGSGPHALSLVQALAIAGANRIVLVDETPRKSEEAMRLYLSRYKRLAHATFDVTLEEDQRRTFAQAYEQPAYQFGSYTTSTQIMTSADYLFAAGEGPFFTSAGVPEDVFGDQILVCHAGVAPSESTFATTAKAAGCNVADGRGALAYAIAQASAVLSQLHFDYLDDAPDVVPDTDEDALLPLSLESMFTSAADALGM